MMICKGSMLSESDTENGCLSCDSDSATLKDYGDPRAFCRNSSAFTWTSSWDSSSSFSPPLPKSPAMVASACEGSSDSRSRSSSSGGSWQSSQSTNVLAPYNPTFLGARFSAPLNLALATAKNPMKQWLHYTHFSILYDRSLRIALLAFANVDASSMVASFESRKFQYDPDLLSIFQYGNSWYRNDPYDRGHLVRRATIRWGEPREAAAAEMHSDYWTNIVPHHSAFHHDEWKAVELAVLRIIRERALNQRAIVVSGVWFDEKNPMFDDESGAASSASAPAAAQLRLVPNAYWKSVVYFFGNEMRSLHFWVPHDKTTTSSVKDLLMRGMDAAQFVVDRNFIAEKIGMRYDAMWRLKKRRPTV